MGIKTYRPNTPGLRQKTTLTFEEITRTRPEKSLTKGLPSRAGRGAGGRVSAWHRGGQHKRLYREIDFRRDKTGIPGKVVAIEYDPNRSANIALVQYADGEKRYILAPKGLEVGRKVASGPGSPLEVGNTLPLEGIPLGMEVHNVELQFGRGGQMVRAAGGERDGGRQGRRLRDAAAAFGGDAHGLPPVQRDRRCGGQRGPHERVAGQGGPLEMARPPASCPRRGDEPA